MSQIHKDLKVLFEHRKNGRKTGRLKWQGTGEIRSVAYQSEGFNGNYTTGQEFGTLTLSKIGEIPIRAHRDLPDTENVKRAILKKDRTGAWFACFVVKVEQPERPNPDEIDPADCIGVDLGIQSYIHTSDDLSVEYDQYAREQRSLDRCSRVGELGETTSEGRQGEAPNPMESSRLSAQAFGVARLGIRCGGSRRPRREADARNQPLGEEQAGRGMIAVSRYARIHRRSVRYARRSRRRPRYDESVQQVRRRNQQTAMGPKHSRPACGHTEDRDLNAAKNILDRGLNSLHVGAGRSESTSPERSAFWLANESQSDSLTPVQTVPPAFARHSGRVDAKHVVEAGSPAA